MTIQVTPDLRAMLQCTKCGGTWARLAELNAHHCLAHPKYRPPSYAEAMLVAHELTGLLGELLTSEE